MKFNWVGAATGNYSRGRGGKKPIAIVVHVMDGTFLGTRSWFNNPAAKASTHYGVSLKGEVDQYVSEIDTAFHAGTVAPKPPAWKGWTVGMNPNFFTLGIEHEGKKDTVWTEAMYKASAELIRQLCNRWKIPCDRDHIVGHREIDSFRRANCPGTCDLDRLVRMAAAIDAPAVEPIVAPGVKPVPGVKPAPGAKK